MAPRVSLSKKNTKSNSKEKKKRHSIFSLIKDMKPTNEELQYRKKQSEVDVEKYSRLFKCTKCHASFRSIINEKGTVHVHPLLGVLMCKDCCAYYGDGNFSLDSDGEDKYCRWCGEGGTIFTCSKCICGFCDFCIKKHFGNDHYKKVQKDDDWVCLFCNPKPLWHLRFICSLAKELSKSSKGQTLKSNTGKTEHTQKILSMGDGKRKMKLETAVSVTESSDDQVSDVESEKVTKKKVISPKKDQPRNRPLAVIFEKETNLRRGKKVTSKGKVSHTSVDDDDSDDSELRRFKKRVRFSEGATKGGAGDKDGDLVFAIKKSKVIENLERILKLTEYHMAFGMKWSTKKLAKLTDSHFITSSSRLKKECQKIKWFISILSTYLIGFSNSIDSIEKNIDGESEVVDVGAPVADHVTYSTIMQFLGFISNQVKAFSEKGISLQSLMESEIYEDDNVLGFKKKQRSKSDEPSTSKASEDISDVVSSVEEKSSVKEEDLQKSREFDETNEEVDLDEDDMPEERDSRVEEKNCVTETSSESLICINTKTTRNES